MNALNRTILQTTHQQHRHVTLTRLPSCTKVT